MLAPGLIMLGRSKLYIINFLASRNRGKKMADETKDLRNEATDNQGQNTNLDYISAINEIKQNSVSREDYDKIREENQALLNSIVNGVEVPVVEQKPKQSIDELRKKIFTKDMTNLEYAQTALDLRDALIESGETDPFLPTGKKISFTASDQEAAQRVADALQDCIDYADGDDYSFMRELDRITIDNGPSGRRR